jgi:hypothetical protein
MALTLESCLSMLELLLSDLEEQYLEICEGREANWGITNADFGKEQQNRETKLEPSRINCRGNGMIDAVMSG